MNAILALILRIILIILAYGFVGGIGYLIYQDLSNIVQNKESITIPPMTVEFELDQESIQKTFSQREIILGRDPSCDLPLDNSTISLRHCRLAFHDKQWWVEDLDSTNGSYLNNVAIETPTVITAGDQLKLGRVLINITENHT
jgi:pSer/pThr/pTyr-binding forkhead associated (FHA) protein